MFLRGKLVIELLKYILTNSFLFCQELGEIATDVAGKYGSHIDMLHLFYIHVILNWNFSGFFFHFQEAENLKNTEHII